jgi:hypothetical protein
MVLYKFKRKFCDTYLKMNKLWFKFSVIIYIIFFITKTVKEFFIFFIELKIYLLVLIITKLSSVFMSVKKVLDLLETMCTDSYSKE